MPKVFGAILRMIETAVGQVPPAIRIDLPLSAPAWRDRYQRLGVAEVRFDQPAFAFHFTRCDLALPCIGADAKAHASACRECEEALAEVAGASLARRVAGLLASVDDGAYPRMADVAARCGISSRTLIRRLHEDGATFQRLLDAARGAGRARPAVVADGAGQLTPSSSTSNTSVVLGGMASPAPAAP